MVLAIMYPLHPTETEESSEKKNLIGISLNLNINYLSFDLEKDMGTAEGYGYGGLVEFPFLFASGGNEWLSSFAFALTPAVQLSQSGLNLENDSQKIDVFMMNLDIPIALGFYVNIWTCPENHIFQFLGTGISLGLFYRPSFLYRSQKIQMIMQETDMRGLTIIEEDSESDFRASGIGVDILFTSVIKAARSTLPPPGLKIGIFVIPGNPFFMLINIGVVQYKSW
jgi:hypothetical protein